MANYSDTYKYIYPYKNVEISHFNMIDLLKYINIDPINLEKIHIYLCGEKEKNEIIALEQGNNGLTTKQIIDLFSILEILSQNATSTKQLPNGKYKISTKHISAASTRLNTLQKEKATFFNKTEQYLNDFESTSPEKHLVIPSTSAPYSQLRKQKKCSIDIFTGELSKLFQDKDYLKGKEDITVITKELSKIRQVIGKSDKTTNFLTLNYKIEVIEQLTNIATSLASIYSDFLKYLTENKVTINDVQLEQIKKQIDKFQTNINTLKKDAVNNETIKSTDSQNNETNISDNIDKKLKVELATKESLKEPKGWQKQFNHYIQEMNYAYDMLTEDITEDQKIYYNELLKVAARKIKALLADLHIYESLKNHSYKGISFATLAKFTAIGIFDEKTITELTRLSRINFKLLALVVSIKKQTNKLINLPSSKKK